MDKSTFDGRIRSAMPRLETTSDSYVDSSSLPIPDQKTLDNYFSDNAQLHFNKKYRKLLHQAELLTGGKTELLSIVRRDGDPSKALKRAKEKLVRFGVMTPGEGHSGTNTPNPLNRLGPLSQLTRPKTANAAVISKPNLMKRPKTAIAGNSSAASFMAKKLERLSREEASQGPMLPRMGTPKVPKSVPPSPTLVRPPLLPNFPVNNAISAVTPFDGNNIEEKGDGIFVDEQSLDDSDYDSDNNHPSYSAATSNGSLASPRSIFLAGCVRYGLPPRSIAMLRKRISPVMNLAHMSIGNPTAILLAEALDRMPYLQTLNLADNNLSDDGLTAIIRCVAKHSTLEVLDISQNTISWGAAKAVGDYVGSSRCFLKSLRMSSAGIDDKECAAFVKVLMNNRMLKELDLSKNMLGKDENLNVVMPDFLTGGESLANLLRYSSCPLETLNLHWNMIRLEGAEILCDSIRNNSYLTDLNLSYNSLGSRAVCLLGMALIDNNRLRRLNLANNGIDSQGAITLSVGMRENQSLQQVILSGNPLGDQGARALMKVMVQEGHRLTVETEDCDITTRQNALALHINNPLGDYLLDMSQPHERAFAYELFDIIARDSNIDVSIFDLFLSSSSGEKVARNVAPDANSRPKSPSKDRNPSSGSGINANGEDGNVDPLAATIRQLGALTASYTIARFDEPKQRYVLSEHEKEEESFFSSLSPLHDVSPVTLLKTVRHYMIVNSDSFSVNNLPSIFDDLLHRRRRYANSVASKTNPDAHEGMKSGILSTDSFDETFILSGNSSGKGLSLEIPSSGNVSRTDSRYEGEGAFLTGITPTSAQSKGKERKEVEAFALGGNDSVFSADESKYDDAYQMPTEEVVRKIAAETRRLLDPRNSGVIDNDVFIEYITERIKGARDRLRQIRHLPRCAALQGSKDGSSSSNPSKFAAMKSLNALKPAPTRIKSKHRRSSFVRYIPPISGWLRLRLVEAFHMSSPLDDEDEDEQGGVDKERRVEDEEDRSRAGYALTMSQAVALIADVQSMCRSNPIPLLLYAIDSTWLRLQEAVMLFSFANKRVDDSTAVVSRILLRMQSGYESRRLVHIYVGDDTMKLRRLKQRLGSSYNTMLNQYSGFYSLDLSNELDRMCLKRLIEKSVRDMSARRLRGLGDTSQHGHWSCFRNEHHRMVSVAGPTVGNRAVKHVIEKSKQQQQQQSKNAQGTTSAIGISNVSSKVAMADVFDEDKKVTTTSGTVGVRLADGTWVSDVNALNTAYVDLDQLISPAFCTPIPQRGRLEFDFVNIERPHPKHCHPVHDDVILDCLLLSRLLAEDEIDWAIDKLRHYQKIARRTIVADGNPMYRSDVGRALQVNESVYNMYTSVPHRQSSRKKVFLREAITSQQGVLSPAQVAAMSAYLATSSESSSSSPGRASTAAAAAAMKGSKKAGRSNAGSVAAGGHKRRGNNINNNNNYYYNTLSSSVAAGVNRTVSFAEDGSSSRSPVVKSSNTTRQQQQQQQHPTNTNAAGRTLSLEYPLGIGSLEEANESSPNILLAMSPSIDGEETGTEAVAADIDSETQDAVNNTIAALFGGNVDVNGGDSPQVFAPDVSGDDKARTSGGSHRPISFRSFIKQGARAQHKLRRWGTRMEEIIYDGTGSDEYKAAALLEFFEAELAPYWLECRQVALILELMAPYGSAARWDYGSYRVEWVVQIFDRLVDLHHFEFIASVLHAEEYAAILCRIGILNIFNPCKCEGAWSLDLGRWEERQVAKMLIHITVDEPGQNWPYKSYQFQRGFLPIPGWELVRRWVTADGLPSKGLLTIDFFTGHGLHVNNCSPDIMLRQMLCALTLPSQRNYMMEMELMERENAYHPEPEGNRIEYEDPSSTGTYNLQYHKSAAVSSRGSSLAAFRKTSQTKRSATNTRGSAASSHAITTSSWSQAASALVGGNSGNHANGLAGGQIRRLIRRIIPVIKFTRLLSQLGILRLLSQGTGNEEERARHREQIDSQESIIAKAGGGGASGATSSKSIRALHAVIATLDDHYHDVRHFTVDDCNEHLRREVEATWQYVSNPKCRPELWV